MHFVDLLTSRGPDYFWAIKHSVLRNLLMLGRNGFRINDECHMMDLKNDNTR